MISGGLSVDETRKLTSKAILFHEILALVEPMFSEFLFRILDDVLHPFRNSTKRSTKEVRITCVSTKENLLFACGSG